MERNGSTVSTKRDYESPHVQRIGSIAEMTHTGAHGWNIKSSGTGDYWIFQNQCLDYDFYNNCQNPSP